MSNVLHSAKTRVHVTINAVAARALLAAALLTCGGWVATVDAVKQKSLCAVVQSLQLMTYSQS